MTESAKNAALTNLECIYDEAVSYINSITHAERYYTKAECDAKYITAANDGSGSGVICETLDGLTAQQILDAGIDTGTICIWSGSEASIPAGWYLCNGLNGTPDLRNRFVIAVGDDHAYGTTGGASHKILSAASIAVGTHAITANELPSHYHSYIDDYKGIRVVLKVYFLTMAHLMMSILRPLKLHQRPTAIVDHILLADIPTSGPSFMHFVL